MQLRTQFCIPIRGEVGTPKRQTHREVGAQSHGSAVRGTGWQTARLPFFFGSLFFMGKEVVSAIQGV